MSEFFDRFDCFEEKVRAAFLGHPAHKVLEDTHSKSGYAKYLLQAGYLSVSYIPWLLKICVYLKDEDHVYRPIIRHLLSEEMPRGSPTHQEDRAADLELFGIQTSAVFSHPAQQPTTLALLLMDQLLADSSSHPIRSKRNDLWLLTAARVHGEVLVSDQYAGIVTKMKEFGIAESSRFYRPHFEHDRKGAPESHVGAFTNALQNLLTDEEMLEIACAACYHALRPRFELLNSVLPKPAQFVVMTKHLTRELPDWAL